MCAPYAEWAGALRILVTLCSPSHRVGRVAGPPSWPRALPKALDLWQLASALGLQEAEDWVKSSPHEHTPPCLAARGQVLGTSSLPPSCPLPAGRGRYCTHTTQHLPPRPFLGDPWSAPVVLTWTTCLNSLEQTCPHLRARPRSAFSNPVLELAPGCLEIPGYVPRVGWRTGHGSSVGAAVGLPGGFGTGGRSWVAWQTRPECPHWWGCPPRGSHPILGAFCCPQKSREGRGLRLLGRGGGLSRGPKCHSDIRNTSPQGILHRLPSPLGPTGLRRVCMPAVVETLLSVLPGS